MRCAACNHNNNATAKFCEECGEKLQRACSSCDAPISATAKFCPECGTAVDGADKREEDTSRSAADYTPKHLSERILEERAAMQARGSADGERKTITALFADLKGSTALIEGLDPEEARAIIDPALQLMMDSVHRYDGYVAQALGDGIFALFGAPIAHEDHPQRALYAALHMQDEMGRFNDTLRRDGLLPVQIRIGANSGEVVVRSIRKDDLHTDYVPVGHSTNIAARMEQLAAPGSIVVTEQTQKLTDGYFDFKDLGETQIKGVDGTLKIFEVTGASSLRSRFDIAARSGLSRFVGRRAELEQLQRALSEVSAGRGQIVGVMGEPGLGKSRLLHEFKRGARGDFQILEAFSISHAKSSPYVPVIELLKTYFDISGEDDERKRREKITGRVLELDRSFEEILPYLFALFGVANTDMAFQQIDPEVRRQRTTNALKQLFLRESLNQALIIIFEDLHWIDNETQAFLDALSEGIGAARVLLLVNYRPEYGHHWSSKSYYTQLRLAPLGNAEAEELLTFLVGTDTSLAPLNTMILERTEGTPFFIEEVVQTLIEEGLLLGQRGQYRLERIPSEVHISPTVQGVLAARIDRLDADEKGLLQQLAVIGREFPLGLLREVVSDSDDDLHRLLSSLQAKEFLYEQPAFPEVEYVFKHALTQEVAYGTVLNEARRALHERTANALESRHSENLEDHYSELAHHYSQTENTPKAVNYLHLAGAQAVERLAYSEAEQALTHALDRLLTLPETDERASQELPLQSTLGGVYIVTKGYAEPEVAHCYSRARELCETLKRTEELIPVLVGLWLFHFLRGEYEPARELAAEVLSLAQSTGESGDLVSAYYVLGQSLVTLGEYADAQMTLRAVSEIYDHREHHALVQDYGEDPGIVALAFESQAQFILGYQDQAQACAHEAVSLAEQLQHDFSLIQALWLAATISQFRGDIDAFLETVQRMRSIHIENHFSFWGPWVGIFLGYGLAMNGDLESGLAMLREHTSKLRGTKVRLIFPYVLQLGALIEAKAGEFEQASDLIDEAILVATSNREQWHLAELHRVRGEIALSHHDSEANEAAESAFKTSLSIARKENAKSWELRSATSVARLWQTQGRNDEARELLRPVYDWFTEGFGTRDLKEAKALLEELSC